MEDCFRYLGWLRRFYISPVIANWMFWRKEVEWTGPKLSISYGNHSPIQSMEVLTWNTQQLLGWANESKAHRIVSILKRKKNLYPGLDIVALQEVFDEQARTILLSNLQAEWPYIVSRAGYDAFGGLGEDSGLMFFSQWPFLSIHFEIYKGCDDVRSIEFLSNKGFLHIHLQHPFLSHVIVTHTQSSDGGKSGDMRRRSQISQIVDYVMQKLRFETVLLMGDLNSHDDMPEIHSLKSFGFVLAGSTQVVENTHDDEGRLDYIMIRNRNPSQNCFFNPLIVDWMNHESDHAALRTSVRVVKR